MWHQSFDEVPDGPVIVLANEFFDALPVNQAIKQFNGWYERVVEIDPDGNLKFGIASELIPLFDQLVPRGSARRADRHDLRMARRQPAARASAGGWCIRAAPRWLIDYGHVKSAAGETLQAVGGHAFVDPLDAPGEVDLTAHVDFQAFADRSRKHGRARARADRRKPHFCAVSASSKRAAALSVLAPPEKAAEIDSAVKRLIAEGPNRDGHAVQGAGDRQPVARHDAGLRIRR